MGIQDDKRMISKRIMNSESRLKFYNDVILKSSKNKVVDGVLKSKSLEEEKNDSLKENLKNIEDFEDKSSTYSLEDIVPVLLYLINSIEGSNYEYNESKMHVINKEYEYGEEYYVGEDDFNLYVIGEQNYLNTDYKNHLNSNYIDSFSYDQNILLLKITNLDVNKSDIKINLNHLSYSSSLNGAFKYLREFTDLIISTCYINNKDTLTEDELFRLVDVFVYNYNNNFVRRRDKKEC